MSTLGPRTALKSRKLSGSLAYILAQTNIKQGTKAAPNDVAGCTLEMGADGLWTGASVGTLTQVQADALVALGAMANLATGATYRDTSGVQYSYGGAEVGWEAVDNGTDASSQNTRNNAAVVSALANVAAGASDFRILCQGDSYSHGWYVPDWRSHFSAIVGYAIGANNGIEVGQGHIPLDKSGRPNDGFASVTVGPGWVKHGSSPYFVWGSHIMTAPIANVDPITIDIKESITGVNVLCYAQASLGELVYSWDGGSKTTVVHGGGSNYTFKNMYIAAPSEGPHILRLFQPSGAQSFYASVEPQNSNTRKVRFSTSGISGATLRDMLTEYTRNESTTDTVVDVLKTIGIDLLIFDIGTNDQAHVGGMYSVGDSWSAHLNTLLTSCRRSGWAGSICCIGLLEVSNSKDYTPSYLDFNSRLLAGTLANNALFIDPSKVFLSYEKANSSGYFSDGIHPSKSGSYLYGRTLGHVAP